MGRTALLFTLGITLSGMLVILGIVGDQIDIALGWIGGFWTCAILSWGKW